MSELHMLKGCGGVYSLLTGQIQSPQYGTAAYSNNLECIWTVRLPPGYHAGLKFVDRFYLETSNNCTSDYVQVSIWSQLSNKLCFKYFLFFLTKTPIGHKI